jgi:hypothetical protein
MDSLVQILDEYLLQVGVHTNLLLLLSDLNKNWNVLTNFSKILLCQILWKSVHLLPRCFIHMDGQSNFNRHYLGM